MKNDCIVKYFAVALLPITLVAAGCAKQEAVPEAVVSVQAATVAPGSITEHVESDAVLSPVAQAAIAPKITAPVKKFYVQRGAKVKAGQLLATLENQDLAGAALEGEGSYNSAQAVYETTTKAQVPEQYQQAQLDLEQAQANLNLNQKIVDSRTQLFSEGAIAGRDVDMAKAALVQAQAAYDAAQKRLEGIKSVGREAALRSAKGQLESAQGKYQTAEADLNYSHITSPISGVVTDRPLYAGETAAAGAPLITVMDISALLAKVHLPQAQAQLLRVGADASVKVPGLTAPVDGKIALVSPALDPGSTTVEVWVRIENKAGELKPGTPVHVTMTGPTVKDTLVIPAAALSKDQNGRDTVMLIGADSVVHQKPVTVGIRDSEEAQITAGLSNGQQVATTGGYGLDDGTKVKVVSAEEMEKSTEVGKKDSGGGL